MNPIQNQETYIKVEDWCAKNGYAYITILKLLSKYDVSTFRVGDDLFVESENALT